MGLEYNNFYKVMRRFYFMQDGGLSRILRDRIIQKADERAEKYCTEHEDDLFPLYNFYVGESKRTWRILSRMLKIKSFGNLEGKSYDKLVDNIGCVTVALKDIRNTRDNSEYLGV